MSAEIRNVKSPADTISSGAIQSRHRVVIVRSGFGGLFAARSLRRADVDVTVIDRNNLTCFRAIAAIGLVDISGFLAWLLRLAVHLITLTGFENRIAVLTNWIVAFVGRGRPQRAITTPQVFARESFEAHASGITVERS
jgi:NADH dehydrogenase